jgi:hypothetical protein
MAFHFLLQVFSALSWWRTVNGENRQNRQKYIGCRQTTAAVDMGARRFLSSHALFVYGVS